MSAWLIIQCGYLLVGGLIAPPLVSRLMLRDRTGEALGNPALGLITVLGVLMLWPALLALDAEGK